MLIRAHEEAGRTRKWVTIFQTRKLRVRDGKGLVQGWEAKDPMWPRSITPFFTALLHMLSRWTEDSSRVKVRSWVRNQSIKQIHGVPTSHFYNLYKSSHTYLWLIDSSSSFTTQLQHHFPERQYLAPRLVRLLYYVFCVNLSCFFTSVYHYKYMYLNDYIVSRPYTNGDRLLWIVRTGANWMSPVLSKALSFSPSLPCRDAGLASQTPWFSKKPDIPTFRWNIQVFFFMLAFNLVVNHLWCNQHMRGMGCEMGLSPRSTNLPHLLWSLSSLKEGTKPDLVTFISSGLSFKLGASGKESACHCRKRLIPGSERSPGGG